MLKLKKIQILGFKSFCDKTEVTLPGHGIAVVVGPNGCGKSNILDGVTWVLGEQSAKSLRGGKMEDVIFAGTRDRRALGMAEVSITLVDPEIYGPVTAERAPEISAGERESDWDENALREQKAREVEGIVAASQPGPAQTEEAEESDGEAGASEEVVLKIRRRRFQKNTQQGEIVVARRLFRTGESEYLLNGKLCRLSDIRDIFMGTGLGPESYAIIGQERIGQLLSSKPHDRRAIIEEAAGITRFKTKKRLAELRLEQARGNLARIDDIFDEVARQMVTLRRQAAKAERYGLLRDELRGRLRVVLASRLGAMDEEGERLAGAIAEWTEQIDAQAGEIEDLGAEVVENRQRGYEVDASAKEQGRLANEAAVELERARNRQASNAERIAELDARTAAGTAELLHAREQLAGLKTEREQHHVFLQTAAGEADRFRAEAARQQAGAREASALVGQAEGRVEAARREAAQLLQQLGQARREQAQAEEASLALDRDVSRVQRELEAARRDLETLGGERQATSLRLESAAETLKRLERELSELRTEAAARRAEEAETRRDGDRLRSERAHLQGRRNSLEALLREHSYSTDTVKKLFRAPTLSGELKPAGTLADFLEVGEQYESLVDEFLRDELNSIVVRSWDAADEGIRLLKTAPGAGGVDGRATFLVQGLESATGPELTGPVPPREGVVGLKDCVRVQDGFGTTLEAMLPKLRDGYLTPDTATARALALQHPHGFFLAPTGECFHGATVTGGKPRAEGPLALKRELRDAESKLAALEQQLAQAEEQAALLARSLHELARKIDEKAEARRQAERESAHEGAALRQMDAEAQRGERRLADYTLQGERARTEREEKAELIAARRERGEQLERTHVAVEARQAELSQAVAEARAAREAAQTEAARMTAELAGLEERRRGAEASFGRIDRMYVEGERRAAQLEQGLVSAGAERAQRSADNGTLAAREAEGEAARARAETALRALTEEASHLRGRLAEAEGQLKQLRSEAEAAREERAACLSAEARRSAELAHLCESCVQDLGLEASTLREQLTAGEVSRFAPEVLRAEEEACREMKRRLEAMGPVNMMALEEFKETETRHGFLETQRKDLLDSIENTRSTIRELDGISRTKFDEAFARINENFSTVFARLFGGGQASMRLTDEEHSNDSGIDIVAQPPGKKLQNVFLLSGGEKALTALSLLMGIFMHQPAPFCVLDEVDAPLDETNVGRLAEMLRSMAADTQFVMVTHSKRMMTAADMIYGVTMQEPGVSKVVSVRLGSDALGRGRAAQRELALV